jgi:starch synthase
MSLSVIAVSSEIFPLVKTGGLADVVGALPGALAGEEVSVRTLVPGYPAVIAALERTRKVVPLEGLVGGPARVLLARAGDLELAVLDNPALYDRPGGPYADATGADWPDNPLRFAALAHAAVQLAHGAGDEPPDLFHCHDWQAGLVPALFAFTGVRIPTVMTVHNLAFQGQYPAYLLGELGLPASAFHIGGLEYYGDIGFLKAGLAYADHVTTVSPGYALEIMTTEHGMGLDGLLRDRAATVTGILNGIDTKVWDPSADRHLVAPYSRRHLGKRERNRTELQARFGLDEQKDTPIIGVVSRLTWQKGMDVLAEALPALLGHGLQLAVLGSGEPALEAAFSHAASLHPGRIGCRLGYDESLAHLIQGGADAILVPSRFEPCGLTQLCALRYGALPLAARVGGLADTIVDANEMALAAGAGTGILFSPTTRSALEMSLVRLSALWRDRDAWRGVQRAAMATEVGWSGPAKRYAELFHDVIARRAQG